MLVKKLREVSSRIGSILVFSFYVKRDNIMSRIMSIEEDTAFYHRESFVWHKFGSCDKAFSVSKVSFQLEVEGAF